jgi:glycosyltransferase involved in cell wall biosynthesis
MSKLLDDIRPDVVHVNSEPWGVLAQQAVLLRCASKVVVHGADNIYDHGSVAEVRIRRMVNLRVLSQLAGFASWNSEGVALARRYGLPADRPVATFPAVVPDPTLFERSERIPSGRQLRRIGFVGRLVPEKGVDWLIEAIAMSPSLKTTCELAVAGTGPEEARLRALAAETGVRAEFVGELGASEVAEFLGRLEVLAVPSRSRPYVKEQFGRVAVEGMLSGLPVIVSSAGSLPEVVGQCGIVVAEGDRLGLATTLEGVCLKASRSIDLGRAAREYAVRSFSPEAISAKAVELWKLVA